MAIRQQVADYGRSLQAIQRDEVLGGPGVVPVGMTLRGPEDADVRIRRIHGHGLIQV